MNILTMSSRGHRFDFSDAFTFLSHTNLGEGKKITLDLKTMENGKCISVLAKLF